MRIKHIVQDLRNAYDAHSRPDFEDVLRRLEKLGDIPALEGCSRGDLCVCNQHIKDVCMYRENKK
jgi:hypothetical protein